jgi:hypothetical protein
MLKDGEATSTKEPSLLAVFLPVFLFSYIFATSLSMAVNDPDVWWHLKTGEYLVEHFELFESDPFAFTTREHFTEPMEISLRTQWLGQVLMYLFYSALGLPGVVILRNLLIVAPMVLVYIWMVRRGENYLVALSVTVPSTLFFSFKLIYTFERPQGISFLLAVIAVMLIERARERAGRKGIDFSYWLLPLTMALWSNIHGGYILFDIILLVYLGAGLTGGLYRRVHGVGTGGGLRPAFAMVTAISIIASFINPNTYKLFYGVFMRYVRAITGSGDAASLETIIEYNVNEFNSLFYHYSHLGQKWLVFYWAFVAVILLCIISKYLLRRRFDVSEFLAVCIIAYLANKHARIQMFSLTVLPYFMARSLSGIRNADIRPSGLVNKMALTIASVLMVVISIGFCTHILRTIPHRFVPKVARSWISPMYPVDTVMFIRQSGVKPPMYNYYAWGGFLMWALYPDYRVFVDGRALDKEVVKISTSILKAETGWHEQLRRYGVNFVVIPLVEKESGRIIPLSTALAEEEDWNLVFRGQNSAVFIRGSPDNRDIIRFNNIDKKEIYMGIIEVEDMLLRYRPGNPVMNIARADALVGLGRYEEAGKIYEKYHPISASRLRMMKTGGR